jgi:hypothetical protein
MLVLIVAALAALFFSPASTAKPVKFGTMTISYAPDSALVINEGETQIFRYNLMCSDNVFALSSCIFIQNKRQ